MGLTRKGLPRLRHLAVGVVLLCPSLSNSIDQASERSKHASAPSRAPYYKPGTGTMNLGETPSYLGRFSPPVVIGESSEALVIASDLGRYIMVLNGDGSVRCRYHAYPAWGPSGIAVKGAEIWFGVEHRILSISAASCKLQREYSLPKGLGNITFVTPASEGFLIGTEMVTQLSKSRASTIVTGRVVTWTPDRGIIWESPYEVSSPRAALQLGVFIVIADSFWHRIFAVDTRTSRMVWTLGSYYPSDMQAVGEDKFLLVEEHLNRVVTVDLFGVRGDILFSCNLPVFRDPKVTYLDMRQKEKATIDVLENPLELSACAIERAGRYTLYSPRSIAIAAQAYYVADTDNQRIVKISGDGMIVREIRNVFSPSAVRIVN